MSEEKTRKKLLIAIGSIIVVIIVLAISYAFLVQTILGEKVQTIVVGDLALLLTEGDTLTLENAGFISDKEGLAQEGFSFSVANKGAVSAAYTITLEDDEIEEGKTRLSDEFIKYSLEVNGEVLDPTALTSREIYQGELDTKEQDDFILRVWLNKEVDGYVAGQVFKVKLKIEAIQQEKKNLVSKLLDSYTNDSSIISYTAGDVTKMYTFHHEAGSQQSGWTEEELTDYRYIGATPNNYITFNDETWRIIGIFTVENESGVKEQRVKIIRDESIGNLAWNATESNNWTTASLMTLLNSGDYYNRIGTYVENGLTSEAKEMITNAKWYLGAANTSGKENYYLQERGINVYSDNSISWIGEVGLMYPSDSLYSYAVGIDDNSYGWLHIGSNQLTITTYAPALTRAPNPGQDQINIVVISGDEVVVASVLDTISARPVVYLKEEIELVGGTGSSSDPFLIS